MSITRSSIPQTKKLKKNPKKLRIRKNTKIKAQKKINAEKKEKKRTKGKNARPHHPKNGNS